MKISAEVLQTFGEAEKTVEGILEERRLKPVAVEHRDGQKHLQVIGPWPVDYANINEAQNLLRIDHGLPVYLELINPDHPIAHYPIEVRTNPAFWKLIVSTLRKYRLYGQRFGGTPDKLIITVSVGQPFEWGRINAAQNELRNYATFEVFVKPRSPGDLHT